MLLWHCQQFGLCGNTLHEPSFNAIDVRVRDPSVSYLTLSHCWGSFMPKRLLKSTLEPMKRSIRFDELSKTFQDALAVTRQLGMRYIWIDSLCIIQDSDEDWRRESAQMGHIYASSHCNLAATSAADGSEGLFFDRDTLPLQPLRVEVGPKTFNVVHNALWGRNVESAPLNRRRLGVSRTSPFEADYPLYFDSTILDMLRNDRMRVLSVWTTILYA